MSNFLDATLACAVTVSRWEVTRQIHPSLLYAHAPTLQAQISDRAMTGSKRLMQCAEYKAIATLDGAQGDWMRRHSLPSLFKKGIYAVPINHLDAWQQQLNLYMSQRQALCQAFFQVYEQRLATAAIRLGPLFDAAEYPLLQELPGRFGVAVRYFDLGVPDKLKLVSPEVFAQARARLEQSTREAEQYLRALLTQEVVQLTEGLYHTLQGLDDGTVKRFYASHVTKLSEWTTLFLEVRNVTDDHELAQAVTRLKSALVASGGAVPEVLKSDAQVRAKVKEAMAGIRTELKGLMERRPLRTVDLTD